MQTSRHIDPSHHTAAQTQAEPKVVKTAPIELSLAMLEHVFGGSSPQGSWPTSGSVTTQSPQGSW